MTRTSKYLLRLFIFLLLLILLGIGSLWWANKYIHSDKFASKIINYSKGIEGLEITHLSGIKFNSYFPLIEVKIPKAKLKIQDGSSEYKLHVDEAIIKTDFELIKSKGTQGTLKLSTQSIRMTEKFKNIDVADIAPYYSLISEMVSISNDINFSLTNESFKYLSINLDTAESEDYSLKNVFLVKGNNELQLNYESDENTKLTHTHNFYDIELQNSAIKTNYSFVETNDKKTLKRINTDILISEADVSFSEFEIVFPDHKWLGSIDIAQEKKLFIEGKLLYEPKDIARSKSNNGNYANSGDQRLFSTESLPIDYLKQFNADVDILIPGIFYNGNKVFSGKFKLTSFDNILSINSDKAKLFNGPIKINFDLNHNTEILKSEVSVKGFDHLINTIGLQQNNSDLFGSGSFDVAASLSLEGNSIAEMFANSNGFIEFSSNNILIKNYLDHALFASGFSFLSIPGSNKTNRKNHGKRGDEVIISTNNKAQGASSSTQYSSDLFIPCFSGSLYIADGYLVAEDGILLDTGSGMLIGTGIIDFHNEKILFDNRVQKESPIGINPVSILKYLSVSGTLANPQVTINKVEAIQKGITTAASLTLGFIPSMALAAIQEMNKSKNYKLSCTDKLFK